MEFYTRFSIVSSSKILSSTTLTTEKKNIGLKMGKHIPRTYNGYNMRCNDSSSDQFNTVAIDVKTIAITSLMESILS